MVVFLRTMSSEKTSVGITLFMNFSEQDRVELRSMLESQAYEGSVSA